MRPTIDECLVIPVAWDIYKKQKFIPHEFHILEIQSIIYVSAEHLVCPSKVAEGKTAK